jgi:CubicO group peptidase (beta-lactamase class C family)
MQRRTLITGALGLSVLAGSCPLLASPRRSSGKPVDALRAIVKDLQTTSMLVLIGGEAAFAYGDISEISYVASVRKSLVSMLFGPSVARGDINLDRSLADLGFDDIGGLLPSEKAATIRDLLRARSGIYHPAANAGDASDRAPARGSVERGSYFLYNNWDFNALGAIFESVTKRDLYRAFSEDIAGPLSLKDWRADLQQKRNDTGNSAYPAHHFGLSTRDMATLGQLMLDRGRANGRQIIPRAWVRETTALLTPAAEVARTSPFIAALATVICGGSSTWRLAGICGFPEPSLRPVPMGSSSRSSPASAW